jgi:hypothetical protein
MARSRLSARSAAARVGTMTLTSGSGEVTRWSWTERS